MEHSVEKLIFKKNYRSWKLNLVRNIKRKAGQVYYINKIKKEQKKEKKKSLTASHKDRNPILKNQDVLTAKN